MKSLIKLLLMAVNVIQDEDYQNPENRERAQKLALVIYGVCSGGLRYGEKEITFQELDKIILDACNKHKLELMRMSLGSKIDDG